MMKAGQNAKNRTGPVINKTKSGVVQDEPKTAQNEFRRDMKVRQEEVKGMWMNGCFDGVLQQT